MQIVSSKVGNQVVESYDEKKYEALKVKKYNNEIGTLKDYDCEKCKNKGFVAFLDENGNFAVKQCGCDKVRNSLSKIRKSGLEDLLQEYTLDKYEATESWQQEIKKRALAFIDDHYKKWFYIGGQVGSGKTFICTAIADEFLKRGKQVVYMKWKEEVVPLKANKTDYDEYGKRMDELTNAEVLYIDDLFKTERGKQPSSADIDVAFELLNYRYNNPELITIISSEIMIRDLLSIDEAVGSRIYQRAKEYQVSIAPDIKKNLRLR